MCGNPDSGGWAGWRGHGHWGRWGRERLCVVLRLVLRYYLDAPGSLEWIESNYLAGLVSVVAFRSSSLCMRAQSCPTLCNPMDCSTPGSSVWQPTRVLCPWDSPGKNTGVGCQALLQGIFPTQGSNLGKYQKKLGKYDATKGN